jgi:vacuolar protein sorting-associated protein 3
MVTKNELVLTYVSSAFDDPYVTTLLPDGTVEIHSIETQALVQAIPAPSSSPTPAVPIPTDRKAVLFCSAGFSVPSAERQTKLRPTPVKLGRSKSKTKTESEPEPEQTVGKAMISESSDGNSDVDDVIDAL